MSFPLLQLVWAALPLVIPIAVVLGHRRPVGPIIVAACAALAAFFVFWVVLGGVGPLEFGVAGNLLVYLIMFIGGLLLLIAAWTIGLTSAAQSRRWRWLVLLVLAGYLSFVAVLTTIAPPNPCFFGSPPGTDRGFFGPACAPASPLQQLLVLAGYVAGPAAALGYALRTQAPRPWPLPGGLTVSPVGDLSGSDAEAGAEAEAEAEAELEVRRERL